MATLSLNPAMLILAREFRGLNQSEFAEKLSITQGTLSKIEMGIMPINNNLLKEVGKILNFPVQFFSREGKSFPPNLYYRKRVTTSKYLLIKDEALMNLHRLNIQILLKSFDFKYEELPVFNVEIDGNPIEIAKKLRALWRLPNGPIINLVSLLESKGIIVVPCNFTSFDIDGRSMFTDNNDILLFINSNMPMDRQRYTLAHELFHIIAHLFCSVDDSRDIEKEANLFAGEFLIPENDLSKHVTERIDLNFLADLKRYYRMSMQAILMKLEREKLITDNQKKYLWGSLIKYGFKKQEPRELEPPKEFPSLLPKMFKMLNNDLDYTNEEIEKLLSIKKQDIGLLYDFKERGRLQIVA